MGNRCTWHLFHEKVACLIFCFRKINSSCKRRWNFPGMKHTVWNFLNFTLIIGFFTKNSRKFFQMTFFRTPRIVLLISRNFCSRKAWKQILTKFHAESMTISQTIFFPAWCWFCHWCSKSWTLVTSLSRGKSQSY